MPTKWTPNSAQRAIIETLATECAKESSQRQAITVLALPFGESKLSKILNALDAAAPKSYFDEIQDPESEMARLSVIVERIPMQRAMSERLNSQAVFEFSQFRAVRVAVDECKSKRTPERLIEYNAPTGGGKSMLCTYLMQKCGAKVVESREAWKRSYFTVLQDLAGALGCRLVGETRPAAMEDEIIKMQAVQTTVLAIDEAEFFGVQAINGLKLLLNKTRLIPVLCAIPEARDRWARYYPMENDQLARRTHAIVELSQISPDDAGLFFPASTFKDREGALKYLSAEASRFGHYSLIRRVAMRLQGVDKNGIDDVKAALAAATREMRRQPAQAAVK
jgi:hypothetical protein